MLVDTNVPWNPRTRIINAGDPMFGIFGKSQNGELGLGITDETEVVALVFDSTALEVLRQIVEVAQELIGKPTKEVPGIREVARRQFTKQKNSLTPINERSN